MIKSGRIYITTVITSITIFLVSGQSLIPFPSSNSVFEEAYELPDGTLRIFGLEYGIYKRLFYMDIEPDGIQHEPVFIPETFNDINFNYAGVGMDIIPLPDGSAILSIDQFDCDYEPPPSLCKLDVKGQVSWVKPGDEFFGYWTHFSQADSNTIAVFDEQNTAFISTQGEDLDPISGYIPYDTLVIQPDGYYAVLGSRVYTLNTNFTRSDSIILSSDKVSLYPFHDSLLLIITWDNVFVVNDQLQIKASNNQLGTVRSAAATKDHIWFGYSFVDEVYQTDLSLQIQDTHLLHKDLSLHYLHGTDSSLLIAGGYKTVGRNVMFIHTTSQDSFQFSIQKDVELFRVQGPESVLYEFELFAYPWGFNIMFRDVIVGVKNNGLGIIDSIRIHYSEGSGCIMCEQWRTSWSFYNLQLKPGQSTTFSLEDFFPQCVMRSPGLLCLRIEPLNRMPEVISENNFICDTLMYFRVSTKDVTDEQVKIYPVPADDHVIIDIGGTLLQQNMKAVIYDFKGRVIYQFNCEQSRIEIASSSFMPGVYVMHISNEKMQMPPQKLIIMR